MPKHNHRVKPSVLADRTSLLQEHCCFEVAIYRVIHEILIGMYELSGVPSISGIYFPGEMTVLNMFRSHMTGVDLCDFQDKHGDVPYIDICEDTLTWAKHYVGLDDMDLHASDGMVNDADAT